MGASPPPRSNHWYYRKGDQEYGPVASSELRRLAQTGQLQPTDSVRKDGAAEWGAASRIEGLFPSTPPVAAAKAAPPRPVQQAPASMPKPTAPVQKYAIIGGLCVAGLCSLCCVFGIVGQAIQKAADKTANRKPAEFPDTDPAELESWRPSGHSQEEGVLRRFDELPPPVEKSLSGNKTVWVLYQYNRTDRDDRPADDSKPTFGGTKLVHTDTDLYLICNGQRVESVVAVGHVGLLGRHGNYWNLWHCGEEGRFELANDVHWSIRCSASRQTDGRLSLTIKTEQQTEVGPWPIATTTKAEISVGDGSWSETRVVEEVHEISPRKQAELMADAQRTGQSEGLEWVRGVPKVETRTYNGVAEQLTGSNAD